MIESPRTLVRQRLSLPVGTLKNRLRTFRRRARLGFLLIALGASATASQAQAPYRQARLPGLAGIDVGRESRPTPADLDSDGDLDLVIGESFAQLHYFKNIGGSSAPSYIEVTGTANPFQDFDGIYSSGLALADLDADGDLDGVLSLTSGTLIYLLNTGTSVEPSFVEATGGSSPVSGIDAGSGSTPTLADLDADGDLDLLIGTHDGVFRYFPNTGSSSAPAYVEASGSADPFSALDVGSSSAPTLADLDADGDLDLVSGEGYGTLLYLLNTGDSSSPAFVEVTGTASAFEGFDLGAASKPVLVDLDADQDFDVLVGEFFGTVRYLVNSGSSTVPAFTELVGASSPVSGPDIGYYSAPALADLDADGDLDAVLGCADGTFRYFVDIGDSGDGGGPTFEEATGSENPFEGFGVGDHNAPALADLDADGDFDAVVGEYGGALRYFLNVGTSTAPLYTEMSGLSNPFSGFDVGYRSTPTLADLDADGDLDAVVGDQISASTLSYFVNTGNASAPAFLEATGGANPFPPNVATEYSTPALADLDRDGDLDTVIGTGFAHMRFLVNTGSPANPGFAETPASANPFINLDAGDRSKPVLADLDGDGDFDLVVGDISGTLRYFRSDSAIFADGFESSDTSAWTLTVPSAP